MGEKERYSLLNSLTLALSRREEFARPFARRGDVANMSKLLGASAKAGAGASLSVSPWLRR